MSFLKERMIPGEKILLKAEVARTAYLWAAGMFLVTMTPMVLIRMLRTQLVLTDRQLLGRSGWLGGKSFMLRHTDIESCSVRQGALGRMLGYGTIAITTKNGDRAAFKAIDMPLVVQQEIEEAVEIAVLGHRLREEPTDRF